MYYLRLRIPLVLGPLCSRDDQYMPLLINMMSGQLDESIIWSHEIKNLHHYPVLPQKASSLTALKDS